jgi:hypothetical protein
MAVPVAMVGRTTSNPMCGRGDCLVSGFGRTGAFDRMMVVGMINGIDGFLLVMNIRKPTAPTMTMLRMMSAHIFCLDMP